MSTNKNKIPPQLKPNAYWDDEAMWSNIETALDKKTKRRGFFWFYVSACLVLMGCLFFIVSYDYNSEKILSTIASEYSNPKDVREGEEVDTYLDKHDELIDNITHETTSESKRMTETKKPESLTAISKLEENATTVPRTITQSATVVTGQSPLSTVADPNKVSSQLLPSTLAATDLTNLKLISSRQQVSRLNPLTVMSPDLLVIIHDTIIVPVLAVKLEQTVERSEFLTLSSGYGMLYSDKQYNGVWSERMSESVSPWYMLDAELSYSHTLANHILVETGINYSRQIDRFDATETSISTNTFRIDTIIDVDNIGPVAASGTITDTVTESKRYAAYNRHHQVAIPLRIGYMLGRWPNRLYASTGVSLGLWSPQVGYAISPENHIVRMSQLSSKNSKPLIRSADFSLTYSREIYSGLSFMIGGRYSKHFTDTYEVTDGSTYFRSKRSVISARLGLMLSI